MTQSDHDKIRTLILSIPKIAVDEPKEDVLLAEHSVGYEGTGKDRRENFEQRNRLTRKLERMIAFNPNADALFPGSLIQGKSLRDGILSPIAVPRTDVTITLTDLVLSDSAIYSRAVKSPTLATVTNAIHNVLNEKLATEQPAKVSFNKTSMASIEEGCLRLGASYSWISGSVAGTFQQTSATAKSLFMVRFVQSYYTVSCEAPSDPASFISTLTPFNGFSAYAGVNNPPTYVSSVTYGRELWMMTESSYESSQMKATLDAAFGGSFASGKAQLSDEQQKMLSESSIQVLLLGGGGSPAVKLLAGDKTKELQQYLLAGASYSRTSPGVVISYVCRYLLDNDAARVSSSTDYTIKTSKPKPQPAIVVKSGLFKIHTGSDDKDDDNHVGIRFSLDDGTILHENGDLPPKQPEDGDPTWHDDTDNPPDHYFRVPFKNESIDTDIHRSITVTIWKSGGAHWHFGYTFIVIDSEGEQYVIGSLGRNDNNFGGDINSGSWTHPLPKK